VIFRRLVSSRRRVTLLSVSAVACLSATAVYVFAYSGADDGIVVPSPSAKASAICGRLYAALPAKVDGLTRHTLEPASRLTAGWGDPTVVLRCGVPRPEVLTPGAKTYDPTSDAAVVNGVSWLTQALQGGGYRFTTTGRKAFVEVNVPGRYAPEINPLADLAAAVRRTVPTEL
jgi:hypothetical protein